MDRFVINGGKVLRGEISVGGMKNSALGILFATILTEDVCVIENLPPVSDVAASLEILSAVGAKVRAIDRTSVEIDTRFVRACASPYELARRFRGSYYILGAELGRFGRARSALPGGCDLVFVLLTDI